MSRNHHYEPYAGRRWGVLEFFEFIYDRHRIWHKRFMSQEPGPWTYDLVLQQYIFCNVFRELDKGTRHLIDHVLHRDDLSNEEKILNAILYRKFNVYQFFGGIVPAPYRLAQFCAESEHIISLFDSHRKNGRQVYNIAYNIVQIPLDRGYRPKDKHVQLILSVVRAAQDRIFQHIEIGAEGFYNQLRKVHCVGSFLAYQLLLDAGLIPGLLGRGMDEFVIVGPGARGGLEIMGLLGEGLSPEDQVLQLRAKQGHYFSELKKCNGKNWDQIKLRYLRLSDIQSCLCEFRKYVNLVQEPSKHKKRLFRPNAYADVTS